MLAHFNNNNKILGHLYIISVLYTFVKKKKKGSNRKRICVQYTWKRLFKNSSIFLREKVSYELNISYAEKCLLMLAYVLFCFSSIQSPTQNSKSDWTWLQSIIKNNNIHPNQRSIFTVKAPTCSIIVLKGTLSKQAHTIQISQSSIYRRIRYLHLAFASFSLVTYTKVYVFVCTICFISEMRLLLCNVVALAEDNNSYHLPYIVVLSFRQCRLNPLLKFNISILLRNAYILL